jgi:hypothetical protein
MHVTTLSPIESHRLRLRQGWQQMKTPGFFRGMVKSKLGDISIVDEPGTLPSWYDSLEQSC